MVTLVRWKLEPLYFIETKKLNSQLNFIKIQFTDKQDLNFIHSRASKIIFCDFMKQRMMRLFPFLLSLDSETEAVGADFSIFSVSWVWMLECKNGNCYLGTHNYILYWYLASLTAQLTISHVTSIIGNWILKLLFRKSKK